MNRLIPFAALAALAGLAGCGKDATPQGGGKRGDFVMPVEVAPVAKRSLEQVVHGTGAIEAYETVQVSARVAGVLDRMLVAEGDEVAKGASIAEIDAERYRLALAQAQAQWTRAKAAVEDARQAVERREQLAKDGRVTTEELEQARVRLLQADADVEAMRLAADKARLDLQDATVIAPIGGVIQTRDTRTGAYLQVGAPLVTLVQRNPLQVRFNVTVADATLLAPGQRIAAVVRGRSGAVPGVIRLVSGVADPGTRQVAVVARIEDADTGVWPGAFAEVLVHLPARDAIVVPGLALRTTDRGVLAYVIIDGKAAERELVIGGHAADGSVEVVSGLRPGESLVVRAADGLSDGKVVRLAAADGTAVGGKPPVAGGRPESAGGKPPGSPPGDGQKR